MISIHPIAMNIIDQTYDATCIVVLMGTTTSIIVIGIILIIGKIDNIIPIIKFRLYYYIFPQNPIVVCIIIIIVIIILIRECCIFGCCGTHVDDTKTFG